METDQTVEAVKNLRKEHSRIDLIGQNGNDGLHYAETDTFYNKTNHGAFRDERLQQCANHSRCVNEQQGSLTEQDYPPATRGSMSPDSSQQVERPSLSSTRREASYFGGMTCYELFNCQF